MKREQADVNIKKESKGRCVALIACRRYTRTVRKRPPLVVKGVSALCCCDLCRGLVCHHACPKLLQIYSTIRIKFIPAVSNFVFKIIH